MTPEFNLYETSLKQCLQCELLTKLLIRTIVLVVGLLLVATSPRFSIFDYANRYVETMGRPINIFMPLILLLAISAFMFKDLEHAFRAEWSQQTKFGIFGAFVRSCTAELLLWSTSVFVTLAVLSIIAFAAIPARGFNPVLFSQLLFITVWLAIFIAFFTCAYLLVRRDAPLLADSPKFLRHFGTPSRMIGFYATGTLIMLTVFAVTVRY